MLCKGVLVCTLWFIEAYDSQLQSQQVLPHANTLTAHLGRPKPSALPCLAA